MTNPLALKLGSFVDLSPDELQRVYELVVSVRDVRAKHTLIREGERPEVVFLLLEGWACRYKVVADGGRQIVAYLLPGDLCDVRIFYLKEMDHSIGLLSDATIAEIRSRRSSTCSTIARTWRGHCGGRRSSTRRRCANGLPMSVGAAPSIAWRTCSQNCGCA